MGAADAAEARIRGYIAGARSDNTRRAYLVDWTRFEAWCAAEGFDSLPASPGALCRFLDHLVAEGYRSRSGELRSYSVATLSRFMASISVAHARAGFGLAENPTKHPVVQGAGKASGVQSAGPATEGGGHDADRPGMVAGLPEPGSVAQGDRTHLAGLRDRALVLVGFAGGSAAPSSPLSLSKTWPTSMRAWTYGSGGARPTRQARAVPCLSATPQRRGTARSVP